MNTALSIFWSFRNSNPGSQSTKWGQETIQGGGSYKEDQGAYRRNDHEFSSWAAARTFHHYSFDFCSSHIGSKICLRLPWLRSTTLINHHIHCWWGHLEKPQADIANLIFACLETSADAWKRGQASKTRPTLEEDHDHEYYSINRSNTRGYKQYIGQKDW